MTRAGSLGKLWRGWCAFWFEADAPANLKLFRVTAATVLFVAFFIRGLDLELLFSDSGVVPLGAIHELGIPMDFRYSLLFLFPGKAALWSFHALFLASLASLALGRLPRLSAAVAFVLHLSFMRRNMAQAYGVDLIATFVLFYLSLAGWGRLGASVAYRFLQLQFCVIYAYSGLEKVKGPPWWNGDAIWGVLANSQLGRFNLDFLASFPLVIVALTYATLAWEIYFPVLVWIKPLRNWVLAIGVLLHLGIGAVINIPFFSALMITSYALFVDERLARKILEAMRPNAKLRELARI